MAHQDSCQHKEVPSLARQHRSQSRRPVAAEELKQALQQLQQLQRLQQEGFHPQGRYSS
jgi:hypothetical protein